MFRGRAHLAARMPWRPEAGKARVSEQIGCGQRSPALGLLESPQAQPASGRKVSPPAGPLSSWVPYTQASAELLSVQRGARWDLAPACPSGLGAEAAVQGGPPDQQAPLVGTDVPPWEMTLVLQSSVDLGCDSSSMNLGTVLAHCCFPRTQPEPATTRRVSRAQE